MTPADQGTEPLGTPRQDAITRATPIGEGGQIAESPCIVRASDDLRQVAEALSAHRRVLTVAVVDDAGALVGIIPSRLLVDELFLQVAPEEFLAEMLDPERIEEYGRMVHARTAGELMQAPVSVTASETFGDAFARMHDNALEGLPVVDAERRPIGYLDQFELIKAWLREHQPSEQDAGP
jgi:CBS domain-containing protein